MAIRVIERRDIGASKESAALYWDMLTNRAHVFGRMLGWVDPAEEIKGDRFDRGAEPVYLIAVDNAGAYRGSLRLLPTTGQTMINDVPEFAAIVGERIESATIWESSRIVSLFGHEGTGTELIAAIGEISIRHGWTQIVTVVAAPMVRVLKRNGLRFETIGTPRRIGGVMVHVALIDAGDPALIGQIYEATGLAAPLIERAA